MACNMSSSARTNGLLVFQDTRNWIGGVMNCSLYEIPLKVNNETFGVKNYRVVVFAVVALAVSL
jgi:hypothetical protein